MTLGIKSRKGEAFVSTFEAITLMLSFGTFTATLIFGVLIATKNDRKK